MLLKLKEDTVIAYETGEPVPVPVIAKPDTQGSNYNEMDVTNIHMTDHIDKAKQSANIEVDLIKEEEELGLDVEVPEEAVS